MAIDKVKIFEALKLIKEGFLGAVKFSEAKLTDGVTIIRYEADKLDVGVAVMAVTEQGAIAMPDGDYEMEDGTKFKIVGGVVSEVVAVDAPAEEGAPAPAAASGTPTPPAAMNEASAKAIVESIIKETRFAEEIAELKTQIAEFKTVKENFATQKTDSEKEINTLKETVKGLFALVETIAGEASATPAEPTKKSFNIAEFKTNYKADLKKLADQSSK